jgi:hypothetical protein
MDAQTSASLCSLSPATLHPSFAKRRSAYTATRGRPPIDGDALEKCRGDDDAWAGYCDLPPKSLADRAKRSLNQLVGGK